MTREEVREKHTALLREMVKDTNALYPKKGYHKINEELMELKRACSHPFGTFDGDIGCWMCPDCGKSKEHG